MTGNTYTVLVIDIMLKLVCDSGGFDPKIHCVICDKKGTKSFKTSSTLNGMNNLKKVNFTLHCFYYKRVKKLTYKISTVIV